MKANITTTIKDRDRYYFGTDDKYYSAEFSFRGLNIPYQFKIRKVPSWPLSVLVREDSDILPLLQVGDVLKVKYYSADSRSKPDPMETVIRDMIKNDNGRFKGHYLVALEILDAQEETLDCSTGLRATG